jgi:acyl carrier protein
VDTPPLQFIREQVARLSWTDLENVRPEGRFIDFGIDSVRAMDLVIELEQAYGIDIPEGDLADLITLQDVADHVERLRAAS